MKGLTICTQWRSEEEILIMFWGMQVEAVFIQKSQTNWIFNKYSDYRTQKDCETLLESNGWKFKLYFFQTFLQ